MLLSENGIKEFDPLEKFFPKQIEATKASERFKFTLYGGSVGSGKSYWLRWASIYWLIRLAQETGKQGIRAGLFCEDYPSLNDRHLSKIKYEFPIWLGKWNEAKHEFLLAPEWGAGILAFRNLDEPAKYLSVEFAIIAIDEINRNPKSTFDFLRTRHRWPGIPKVRFLAACNPLGEAWVKNLWVKRLFPKDEKEQYEFVFVPALPTDNPYLPAEYYKSLESLPEAQRKAYLEGNWDAFDETMDEKGYIRLINDRELRQAIITTSEHAGYKILGIDPAAGGDNSAIVLKSTTCLEILFNQKLQNTMDLVGVVMEKYRDYKCDYIVVDKTGIGQGVYDRLKDAGYPIRGVAFGEKSDDKMFANLKADWHWRLRKWLLSGGKLLDNYGWNELEHVKYKNKDGVIQIQPKEELFREGIASPNCVDAAILTMVITDSTIRHGQFIKQAVFKDKTIEIWNEGLPETG